MMMMVVVVVMVSVENVKIPVLRDELYCFLLIVVILCLVTDFVIIDIIVHRHDCCFTADY